VQWDSAILGSQHGSYLPVRAGIDTGGPVTNGLVLSAAIYDMWDDSVNLTFPVRADHRPGT